MKNIYLALIILLGNVSIAQNTNYEQGVLIVKIKEDYRSYFRNNRTDNPKLENVFNSFQVESIKKEYPHSAIPREPYLPNGMKATDISRIYRVKYSANKTPYELVNKFMSTGAFEYAEPSFTFQPLYTPNDPDIGSLWFLDTIKAYQAWDVTKGDTNVVIGISDTGFDIDHPDLVNSVKYNYNDTIDGVDNDGDGYIDNYRGYDLGDNDNNPSVGGNWHGIFVSGVAGATTDNNNQLAGVGFNCKLLPLKIENSSGQLTGAYNSIIYAADHGADVVNCSWGSPNSWSQQGQDIVRYATVDKNCLVVASAGNSNDEGIFYPASFDFVLSVGGTDTLNQKWVQSAGEGSNYNEYVDIVAPSMQINRINNGGGTLGGGRGTSFSAPMVAGAAGIVKAAAPSYTAIQVMLQLKATADASIYDIPFNGTYSDKLGIGLLDMASAVTDFSNPGFLFDAAVFTDNDDEWFIAGDTVYLYGNIYNMLATSSAGSKISLECSSPYIELIDSSYVVGSIPSGNGGSTSGIPFAFKVKSGVPVNEEITFKVVMEDGSYKNWQMLRYVFNTDYVNVHENNIKISVGASGKIGFAGDPGQQTVGVGVVHNGADNILFQMGVMAGLDANKTSYGLDGDFEENKFLWSETNMGADYILHSFYDDDPAGADKIGVTIHQKTMAWNEAENANFVVTEMVVHNTSGADINNLNLGLFSDWDISTYSNNYAVFDSSINTGYCYFPGGKYGGVHILGDSSIQHYAFDNSGANGSINQYDGFSSSEQFSSISNGDSRNSAGVGDVSQTVGVGGLNIPAGDSIKVAFAIVVGDSYAEIASASLNADTAYNELYTITIDSVYAKKPLCNGDCNGALGVSASGGAGNLSFLWDDVSTTTNDTVSNLCAGTYKVVVEDEKGLKDSLSLIIEDYPALSISITDTIMDSEAKCEGEITAVASGGIPPYTIAWDDNAGRDSLHAVDLCVGDYILTITDTNACIVADTISISNLVSSSDVLQNVYIHPNPTSGMVNFDYNNFADVEIKIYNQLGSKVGEVKQGEKVFSFDGLPAGNYYIQIKSSETLTTKKVVVVR